MIVWKAWCIAYTPVSVLFCVCLEVEFSCAWVPQAEHKRVLSTLWGKENAQRHWLMINGYEKNVVWL